MSPYRKAWLFGLFQILVIVISLPLVGSYLYQKQIGPQDIWPIFLGYGAFASLSFLFRCPDCRSPMFMRGPIGMPWPNMYCSRCGRNLSDEYLD